MKLLSLTFATLFSTITISSSFAQVETTRPGCGTRVPSKEWDEWFNAKVENYRNIQAQSKGQPITLTIPVIVHVIHGGQGVATYPNLSAAQIRSQIKVLNDDFGARGYGINNLAATGFSAVGAADTKITFCLAQFNPSGDPLTEAGIDRINYLAQGWANPASFGLSSTFQNFMNGTVKPATIWDPTYYFNIWVSDVNPSAYLLGYATFPGGSGLSGINSNVGSGNSDGIWVWGKAFGTTGWLDGTYNRGRTAVHETGHWLGLRHIGGDAVAPAGDCNATDFCADTPPQKGGFGGGTNGQNFGSPVYPIHVNVCSSPFGDMFMNFMDYCDDGVLTMFTPNQNERMQAAMVNGYFRSQLSASSATQCVGLPVIDFVEVQQGCENAEQTLDFISLGEAASYTWMAKPASGVVFSPSANSASPAISYAAAGNYTITVITTNSIGTTVSQAVVEVNTCTGLLAIDDQKELQFSPIPASGQITITYPDGGSSSETLKVIVYDGQGSKLIDSELSGESSGRYLLNVSQVPNGIYFIHLQRGEQRFYRRIVVNH